MNRDFVHGLWDKQEYVPYRIAMIRSNPTFSGKNFASLGYPVLGHLTADGAGLAGGQVIVVTVDQIDTDLIGSLPLELLHGSLSLGDVEFLLLLRIAFPPLLIRSGKGLLSGLESIFLSVSLV